jgi:predicted enzyme related to lactoylglutathione lyase
MTVSWLHAFIDVPAESAQRAREFWSAVTTWTAGEPWAGHPEFTSLTPPDGAAYLHVQTIGGPARVHLDVVGHPATEVERLEALGARREHPGDGWYVMSSPGGLPFCVCDEGSVGPRPGPATLSDGNRTRVVQICVDVPDASYDAELAFWTAATGWADEPVDAPEYHRLVHRESSALTLLVQRLGKDDPGHRVRAHLDIGTTDIPTEVERVRALGATVVDHQPGITVLRDPLGLPFCVTGRRPES